MNAAPTGLWAVDRVADRDGRPLPVPVRLGVFAPVEVAREFASQRREYPRSAYRVAELWQGRRPDGSLLPAYVPGDAA